MTTNNVALEKLVAELGIAVVTPEELVVKRVKLARKILQEYGVHANDIDESIRCGELPEDDALVVEWIDVAIALGNDSPPRKRTRGQTETLRKESRESGSLLFRVTACLARLTSAFRASIIRLG